MAAVAAPAAADHFGTLALGLAGKTCVVEHPSGRRFSWQQLVEDRNRLASALSRRGVAAGDPVVAYGHNSYEWVLVRAAVPLLNGLFVPMNWHLAAPEVAYIVDNCDATALVLDGAFAEMLHKAKSLQPGLFAKVRSYVVWGDLVGGFGGAESLASVLADGNPAFPQVTTILQRSMLYTGGTSGKPKAVLSGIGPPHAANMDLIQGPEGLNMRHPDNVHLVAAPLYHAAPGSALWRWLQAGTTMVIMRKFDAIAFLALVEAHGVKTSTIPPILVKRIADLPEEEHCRYSKASLKAIVSAGAHFPMPVKEAAIRVGLPIYEFYGSSELGLNTVLRHEDMLRKPGSCGRIAPGLEVKIISDDGSECPRGAPGLLYVRCGQQLSYHKAGAKGREAQLKSDPSFMTVGDVAYLDEDDFVYICDRKIDMVVSGGVNIYPAEIEDCLFRHPGVADVAVFGMPDPEYGERVHAAVLLKGNAKVSVRDLQVFARRHIAGFKVPRDVSFHTDFPRTPAGKVLKRPLRELCLNRQSML